MLGAQTHSAQRQAVGGAPGMTALVAIGAVPAICAEIASSLMDIKHGNNIRPYLAFHVLDRDAGQRPRLPLEPGG